LAGFTLDKSGEVPERISDDNWLTIESLLPQTGLTRRDLELLIEERERTFLASQIAASAALSKMNEDERTAAIAGYRREMQAAALRLRMARGALAEP
jgi:class 3 adenylate cyclase